MASASNTSTCRRRSSIRGWRGGRSSSPRSAISGRGTCFVDDATLRFYRENAQAYADWAKGPSTRLTGFLASLPPGGTILELGCGAGNHTADMLAAGFSVHPTDGAPERAEIASHRLGHPVQAMLFHEIDG